MSQDNKVVIKSTTTHGYLYSVFHKDDTERKNILYRGEISDDSKHAWCECMAYVHGKNCYHQKDAWKILEVPIV